MDKFLKTKRPVAQCDASQPEDAPKAKRRNTSDKSTEKKSSSSSSKMPKKKASSAKNKGGKIAGKTLEQHRRAMGDVVKKQITVEKYCIEARTHCTIKDVEPEVFRKLILTNASSVVPDLDDTDEDDMQSLPVIVASIKGSDNMAAIFGATKIKGGNRMASWSADKGEIIYLPESKEMRVWWTMR